MSKIKNLDANLLKRIIREEKVKIQKETTVVNETTQKANSFLINKEKKLLEELREVRLLRKKLLEKTTGRK